MAEQQIAEITKEIVKEIRKAGTEATDADVYVLVEAVSLLKQYPPLNGYRKDNAKYAAKFIKWIEEGERLMKAHPEGFNFNFLFAPDPVPGESALSVMQRAAQRYEATSSVLARLRERCRWIISNKFGEHRSAGYQQERAAIASRELMERLRLPLAYSSSTSTYRSVARLLYQAMLGREPEDGEDIERACEAVARGPEIVTATET
jgi:hypothetical protein